MTPAVFVGRAAEIERIARMLARVSVAVIYGVPGVGKSSLAQAVARRFDGRVVFYKASGAPLAVLLDDLRRQLARGPVREGEADTDRVASLADLLDNQGALCVIDDVHRLDSTAREALVRGLGEALRVGRVLLTSRELIPPAPDGPDRFELRLGALDVDGARSLWETLDELYGPAGPFEAAWQRSRGNPLFLRRAHARTPDGDDPVAATMRELSGAERRIASALSLSELRLPAARLAALASEGVASGQEALLRLTERLVVELDASGSCGLHDLYRDALLEALEPDERPPLHTALAEQIRGMELDPVMRTREVCRHLRAIGRFDVAADYLVENSAELIRYGAAGELVRAIDAIPASKRSTLLQVLRARTLGRVGDLRRAYDEIERLVRAAVEPRVELKLALGQLAMLTARFEVGEQALREVIAEPDLPDKLRLRAETAFILTRTHLGHGDDARAFSREAEARATDPLHASHLRFCRSFSFWIDGRQREAEEPMRAVYGLLREGGPSFRGGVLAPAFFVALMAQLGRFDEAEEALGIAEAAIAKSDDIRTRMELRSIRGVMLSEVGHRRRAVVELKSAADSYRRTGYTMALVTVEILLARPLFRLGRRREALAVLDEAERIARSHQMASAFRMIESALEEDPLRRVREELPDLADGRGAAGLRAGAFSAVRAAMAGDARRARSLIAEIAASTVEDDYPVERALTAIASAVVARGEGRAGEIAGTIAAAAADATGAGADDDLVAQLWEAVDAVRVVARTVPPRAYEDHAPSMREESRPNVVIDRERHEIRAGGAVVSLKTRRVLRRLLYVLASRPNAAVSRDDLVQEVWAATYHPLVHDNVLLVNITRLRALLDGTGLAIEADEGGYRLLL